MIKGMGAIPTPVEISEIMPALMTGLVEGQENPLNNIIARKMWEANKYVMMTSHMESVLAVFINEKSTSVPEGDRKLMQEAFDEMGKRSLQWAKEAEAGEIDTSSSSERRHDHRRPNALDLKGLPRSRHQSDPDRLPDLEGLLRKARRREVGPAN